MFRLVWVAILSSFLAAGSTEDEIMDLREYISEITKSCMKKFEVSMEDYDRANKNKDFSGIDACFFGCLLKDKGLIDDKGMFNEKIGYEIAEKFIKSPEDRASIKKISETCKSVNEQAVSDGEKGCERAVLLVQCLYDNNSKVM
nr:odorant binding protein 12 [Apocheima cinerarius]